MTDATVATIVVAIMTALPPTLVALAGLRQGKKTEAKQDVVVEKVDQAAALAETAAAQSTVAVQQVSEVHSATKALTQQSGQIMEQTNGHLARLVAEIKQLRALNDQSLATIATLTGLLHQQAGPSVPVPPVPLALPTTPGA
jgi:ABC-type transporter Mla subunit MlaD